MALSIAEIIILCLIADWLCRLVRLPGLIGMLLVGVLLGPYAAGWLDESLLVIGPDLRMVALIVILLRAGFAISRKVLHRVGGRVLLLSCVPSTIEAAAITLAGSWLLGLSMLESAILGSVLGAVSPAVVVPAMLQLSKDRRGTGKDIPAMVMAAASVDNVYVIVLHGVVMGLYLGREAGIAGQIVSIPLSLVFGIVIGLLAGVGLYRMFERFNPRATKRALVVIAIAILLVRLQYILAGVFPFAGLVAAMAIGFIILERREHMAHEIAAKLAKTWVLAEIILFSMVGAQFDIGVAWHAGLAGMALIGLGLLARSLGVLLCLAGSRLGAGERLFVAVAYSPKATVQAAIGAAPLLAMRLGGMDTGPGELILAVAVMSIILTAPAGAWAIAALAPRLLAVEPES